MSKREEPTNELVDHFFRHESANLVAVLTRAFGIRRFDLVEDMVQVALLEAMNTWKRGGVPDNPAGWIHRVAKNRILDAVRREKTHERVVAESGTAEDQPREENESLVDQWLAEDQIPDSLLRMIFVCCHPMVERKTQIALTLKTLCGFGLSEIASGLLLPIETVKKRIQRAKKSLAAANVSLELPRTDELAQRLDVVHDVLYLMFNEGYSTSAGAEPIRDDICEEAVRLCHMLCESSSSSPTTRALLALMLFHAARLEARTDGDGIVILLEDQDRQLWDHRLIDIARGWLLQSKAQLPTRLHLEAAIAMQHCVAPSVEDTDWGTIVQLYSRLLQLGDSPLYVLNRAIAMGQGGNIADAKTQLSSLRDRPDMQSYQLLDSALGRIHELEGDTAAAIDCYSLALSKAVAPHERVLLERRLQRLGE